MQKKEFITFFRGIKVIQLCVLLVIEAVILGIFIANPSLTRRIHDDPPLYQLCVAAGVMMIFALLCLLYDFIKLRFFAKLKREALLDGLTGIPNRHGLDVIFQTYTSPESMANVGCYMVTIENLTSINQTGNRRAGDRVIQDFCSILTSVGDSFGTVGRNSGNDFLVVIDNCGREKMESFHGMLQARIADYNRNHEHFPIRIKSTYILNSEEGAEAFSQLLIATYGRLHGMNQNPYDDLFHPL